MLSALFCGLRHHLVVEQDRLQGDVIGSGLAMLSDAVRLFWLSLANSVPRLTRLNPLRIRLLRLSGMHVGANVTVWGPVVVVPAQGIPNIWIGDGSFLNTETRFGCPTQPIIIGKQVQVGPRVSFKTVNHGPAVEGKPRGALPASIAVGDRVWIGSGRSSCRACGSAREPPSPPAQW